MPLRSERAGGKCQAWALLLAWPLCSFIMQLKLSNLSGPWESICTRDQNASPQGSVQILIIILNLVQEPQTCDSVLG